LSWLTNIAQKLLTDRINTQTNRLDEYVLRMLAQGAIYPDANSATYLKSYTGVGDVFTIINKITEPASMVPIFQVDKAGNDIPNGRMLQLLSNPNPGQSTSEFIEALLSFYLIFGNAYIAHQATEYGLNAGQPIRLDVLPPQWMEMVIGSYMEPVRGWKFIMSGNVIDYEPSQVMHWKDFNPDYDNTGTGHLYGMSRLKPILKSVIGTSDSYNAVISALQHQGAFGILTILGEDGKQSGNIGKAQLSAIQREYERKYTGAKNAGKIVVTKWDHKWTNFGMSAKEMEIFKSLGTFKGNLCDAYNVPSQLLTGSQDRTYSNYKEAERALWGNAIKPNLDGLLSKLSAWLAPQTKELGHRLVADYSEVEALQHNKVELVQWMTTARSFTRNEIREACGYERIELPEMDKVYDNAGVVPINELTLMPGEELTEDVLKALKISDYRKMN